MRLHLCLALLVAAVPLCAQEQVTMEEVKQHLLPHPAPVLSSTASDAIVEGTVTVRLTIDATGHVTSADATDGPDLLRPVAVDTVQRWAFRPFHASHGKPIVVSGILEMTFTLSPADLQRRQQMRALDQRTQAKFFPLMDKCHAEVRAGVAVPSSDACVQAATLAQQFNPQERFIERRGAYVFAALWLLENSEGDGALKYAQLAVAEVEQGHDDDSGGNAAYTVRGEAEALLGQWQQANNDLSHAEDLERKAIAWAVTAVDSDILTRNYTSALKRNLRARAVVLQRLSKKQESDEQLAELRRLGG